MRFHRRHRRISPFHLLIPGPLAAQCCGGALTAMVAAVFLQAISVVAIVPMVVAITVVSVVPVEPMIVAIESVVIAIEPMIVAIITMIVAIVTIVVAAMVAMSIVAELARGENCAACDYQTRRLVLLSQEQSRSGHSQPDGRVALALFAGLRRDRRANRREPHHSGECNGGQAI